jgi:hypothetical protein
MHIRRERRRIDFATFGAEFIAIVSFAATLPGCGFVERSSAKLTSQHLVLCSCGDIEITRSACTRFPPRKLAPAAPTAL